MACYSIINVFVIEQGFDDKRCFLPHVNTRISAECPDNYTFNPDNEYIKIRYRELAKGSYNAVIGLKEEEEEEEEEIIIESEEEQSSSGTVDIKLDNVTPVSTSSSSSFNRSSNSSSKKNSSSSIKQEPVQLYPQEVSLRLRISKLLKCLF
jgi:integrin beta 1